MAEKAVVRTESGETQEKYYILKKACTVPQKADKDSIYGMSFDWAEDVDTHWHLAGMNTTTTV